MAPPQDRNFTGEQHPENCFLVCFGHQITTATATNGTFDNPVALNIYAYKDRENGDKIYFCAELYNQGGTDEQGRWYGGKLGEHKFMEEAEYLAVHMGLWRDYDMEPNRDFNIGEGLRSEGGAHLSGSNRLVESNGTLKMQAIHDNCP